MKYFANLLAEKLTANREMIKPAERYRVGLIESWVSIACNIFLALLKMVFGLLTNSIALIADAVHSASDIFSSMVVLIGFTMAKKEPDSEHPHGHGRTEYLAGLIIGLMLSGAGIAFIFSSYNRLISDVYATPSIGAIIAVIIAMLIKEFLYYFSARLGKLIDSDTLSGDAWHHRTDSLSSGLVLIALVGNYLGLTALDAYFGFLVALFIIYAGYKIARSSCSALLGTAPSEELYNAIVSCAKQVDGVIDTHDLEFHDYGSYKAITIHIGVNGSLSLDEAHEIAHRVEELIGSQYHCNAVVHIDPR